MGLRTLRSVFGLQKRIVVLWKLSLNHCDSIETVYEYGSMICDVSKDEIAPLRFS